MVNQLKSVLGLEHLTENQMQSKLDTIISKHPYFHLAQLYRLQWNQTLSTAQISLTQVAVNTYQRGLLKHWLEKEWSEKKQPSSTKKRITKSIAIDELIDIPNEAKVIRPNPNSEVSGHVDLSKKRLAQSREVYTETLAELYFKQNQYHKAIEVLTFLKSTDSKKSDYFAGRIEEILKQQKESKHNKH